MQGMLARYITQKLHRNIARVPAPAKYVLPDLCDEYPELVRVMTPMFRNFGARLSFGGSITTIKCHEDNSLVAGAVNEAGDGRVLVVDGGGSLHCGLLGDNLAMKAANNDWEGIVIYGCVRDVDALADIELGIQAITSNPMKSIKREIGLRDETVTFGGVDFVPGEYLYADNNGVIVSAKPLTMPGG